MATSVCHNSTVRSQVVKKKIAAFVVATEKRLFTLEAAVLQL